MKTINYPEKIIPAYSVDVFEYEELSEEAKDNAYRNFATEENLMFHHNNAIGEIWYCVTRFLEDVPADAEIDAYGNFRIGEGVSYRNAHDLEDIWRYPFVPVGDIGECYSMDICEAWNAHVEMLEALREIMEDTDGCSDIYYAARESLEEECRAALEDVLEAVQRDLDAEFDYYYGDPRQFFEDFDAYEHTYTADGEIYDVKEVA